MNDEIQNTINVFLSIGIIVIILWVSYKFSEQSERIKKNQKEEQRKKNDESQKERVETIKKYGAIFNELFEILKNSYDLRFCPSCNESKMIFNNVSPTGKSFEYTCLHCKKRIIGKLFVNKGDGIKAVEKFNELQLFYSNENLQFEEENVTRLSFEVESVSNYSTQNTSRELIAESVKHEVWRRDQGKCVICGSQKNLEFDHIIPFSKGGSNTVRNIQLLCESCNRSKSDKI